MAALAQGQKQNARHEDNIKNKKIMDAHKLRKCSRKQTLPEQIANDIRMYLLYNPGATWVGNYSNINCCNVGKKLVSAVCNSICSQHPKANTTSFTESCIQKQGEVHAEVAEANMVLQDQHYRFKVGKLQCTDKVPM